MDEAVIWLFLIRPDWKPAGTSQKFSEKSKVFIELSIFVNSQNCKNWAKFQIPLCKLLEKTQREPGKNAAKEVSFKRLQLLSYFV